MNDFDNDLARRNAVELGEAREAIRELSYALRDAIDAGWRGAITVSERERLIGILQTHGKLSGESESGFDPGAFQEGVPIW